jgi:hypothetical protein
MTLFLGSGLLKRIEAPEGYSSFAPELGGVSEHLQQLLARHEALRLSRELRVDERLPGHRKGGGWQGVA